MEQPAVKYVTFRAIAKDCELHPEETAKDASGYLKALLGIVWRDEFSINGESIVHLDYDTTRADYYRVDRVFLRGIIGLWPREKELFRSLPNVQKMTKDDWNKLSSVQIENIPASTRESILERLAFRMTELHQWLMDHDSVDWLTRWWDRNAEGYGCRSSLRMDVEARCIELIRGWSKELTGIPRKRDLVARARSIIGVGFTRRAFDRAWVKAAPQHWKDPGRRPSLTSHVN